MSWFRFLELLSFLQQDSPAPPSSFWSDIGEGEGGGEGGADGDGEGGEGEGGVCFTTTVVNQRRVGVEPLATFFDLSDSRVVEAEQVEEGRMGRGLVQRFF